MNSAPAAATTNKNDSAGTEVAVETATEAQVAWFDQQLTDAHYLGAGRAVGDYLRQVVKVRGRAAALLVWGPACYALKDRDQWISWSANQRVERLKLIVQNRRFLILGEKGQWPNLASQAMGAALRALPGQWQERFGYRPLLAESFTDPEAYAGTCYKASNWEPVGFSAGYSRHRADFYVANDRPKRLWLRELDPQARRHLRAAQLPAVCQPGLTPPPGGALPLPQPQLLSLLEALRLAPDPRAKNTRFRSGPVLTLVAMALLAGRREIAEIARFATTLSQKQRHLLGLPRKKTTRAFYQVPTYSVFYALLTRLDAEAFAAHLHAWLQTHANALPQALAMDGKSIRDHIGLLTLAQHEDGAPQAVAIYDQKEGTPRCEQTVATAVLASLPTLDNKTITADALHCLRPNARAIVEKGGAYLLQIKANQQKLLGQAKACDALPDTPFFSKAPAATAGSNTAACMPSPSTRSKPTSPSPAV
ncbi:MAG: ISAs1 family transposase [Mycobacterium sp.]